LVQLLISDAAIISPYRYTYKGKYHNWSRCNTTEMRKED
jgi:hypothetical protein